MGMKVGIICYENPFIKPSTGGKKCIKTRIMSLISIEKIELDIYLIQMPGENQTDTKQIYELSDSIKNVFIFKGNNNLACFFSKYPICNKKRFVKKCTEELKKHFYDFFIYEGEQIAIYRLKNAVKSKRHIIYMHDIESEYRKELAKSQSSFFLKFMQYNESSRFKYIEKRINNYFDEVWFISNDELNRFKPKLSPNKGVYVPMPALDVGGFVSKETNGSILYVGDLRLKNNLLSLEWFSENVFPKIKEKLQTIVMNVVGSINDNDRQKITSRGINVLGYVDDIESMYHNSSCFACPVAFGAGVKVKTIDALSKGMVVVTTTKGVEGTELKNGVHLFVCDDAQEMANIIVDISKNAEKYEAIKKAGYDFVKRYHSIENQTKIIELTFQQLLKRSDL